MEHDHLVGMLNRLKLTAIRDQLDRLIDEAGGGELTVREALSLFCEREIARKDERRIEMGIGLARFPFVRDLDGFDFAAQPLGRQKADPGDRERPVHCQRRSGTAAWPTQRRQDASGGGDRSPGDSDRLLGALRAGADAGGPARQGAQRGPARGPATALHQAEAADH